MRIKILLILLIVLFSMAACKPKVQDPGSTPAADTTSDVKEQTPTTTITTTSTTPMPMESQDQAITDPSASEETASTSTSQNDTQASNPADMNKPAEDGMVTSAETQAPAPDSGTSDAPAK
jgi:hypothetical protein